jgi:Tfp pilus assembly protein PilV
MRIGKIMRVKPSSCVTRTEPRCREAGSSLVELAIAGFVLTVGMLGGMVLITTAIANNGRNKTDSTATLLSQMTLERIASVPANATATSTPSSDVTIVDCNPSVGSASHTVNTLGVGGNGAGAPLTAAGSIDFTATQVTGYSLMYYNCQASTGDRQAVYDVRWNVKTINANAKLVTVSAQLSGASGVNDPNRFAPPVSLKMIVGL